MKVELTQDRRRLIFFTLMLFIGAVAIIIYSALTGNTNQIFTDVVNEITAQTGSNKSAEKELFYYFAILGGMVYFVYYLFFYKKDKDVSYTVNNGLYVLVGLSIFLLTSIIVYKSVNIVTLFALLLGVITYKVRNTDVVKIDIFYFIIVYSLVGLYRLYVFCGGNAGIDLNILAVASFIFSIIMLLLGKDNIYYNGILIAQIYIPFVLLIYLTSSYLYLGQIIKISAPLKVQIIIWVLVIVFLIEVLYRIFINFRGEKSLQNSISFSTLVSIMVFNQYMGTGSAIDLDLHHHFEDIIGYSQIFELGQKPFSQYIPVSGLYSVLQGFFFALFGRGNVSFYNLSANIYYLAIIVAIAFLLKKSIKVEWVLLIALIFSLGKYNRVILLAPHFLLLTQEKLINSKNMWLKVWIFSTFLHGLYYPVYGAAIGIGFLPFALWQIYSYSKDGKLKKDIKTFRFWISWIICFIPIVMCGKILIGMARHMLAMAGQTIYADGITRFAQVVPDVFLPFISSLSIKLVVYYLFSYLIIVAVVWLSVALSMNIGGARIENRHLIYRNPIGGLLSLTIGLIVLVSISYSVVRLDLGNIYARSEGVIKLSFVIVVFLLAKYWHSHTNSVWVLGFACFSLAIVSAQGYYNINTDSKLEPYYNVSEEYVYVKNDVVQQLGECFIPASTYEAIENSYINMNLYDKEKSYLGVAANYGEYYLNGLKGDSVLELYLTVKGYDATQETVDNVRRNGTIIGYSLDPVNNYYMYHYLAMSGEYIWDPSTRLFTPNTDDIEKESIFENNKEILPALEDVDLGKTAGSWGSSINSLEDNFENVDCIESVNPDGETASIEFNNKIYGDDADFIYLEFCNMDYNYKYSLSAITEELFYDNVDGKLIRYLMKKNYNPGMKVRISWYDDNNDKHTMICDMDEGKLLIPLGAGKGWLFDSHNKLEISVYENDNMIQAPAIKTVQALKLQEIK